MDADTFDTGPIDLYAEERLRFARIVGVSPSDVTDRALLYLTTYAKSDASVLSLWRTINEDGQARHANKRC